MKKKKVVRWLFLLLLLAVAIIAFCQRNMITVVMQGTKYSPEEIEQQLSDNAKKVQEAVEDNSDIHVRDLTEEEKKALKTGSVSREDTIEQLIEKEPTASESNLSEEQVQYQRELSSLIAEIYVMQAEYNNKLENMIEQAKQEYAAMGGKDRSKTALIKWASGFVSHATSLEKECDDKMDKLIAKLSDLIQKNSGDDSIVDQVITTYAQEKSLKKAWYLSEMQKRGLLG